MSNDKRPGPPQFSSADSEDALWQKMLDYLQGAYGVTCLFYAFTHSKFTISRAGIMPSIYMRHDYPEDYLAHFGGQFALEDSLATALILDGETQVFWSDLPGLGPTPGQRAQIAIDQTCGMNVGISFGYRFGANSGFSGLCWACRHGDAQEFRREMTENQKEIAAVNEQFQLFMRRAMVANSIKLTPREREVLSYSAGGMTAKQIAVHLGLSPKTVTNTLERARGALGAVSTMEAVAKALVYELLN